MSNIVKSNFTSLNGLNDESIDNLVSDTISTKKLYVDGVEYQQGQTGPQGNQGQSVSFYTPTVLTLIPGSTATVSDVITTNGNIQNHQLTLGIPIGNTGAAGASFVYKGNFIQQTQYYINDVVYVWGSAYICIQNTNSYIPKDDTGNYGVSYTGTIDNSYLYWKYMSHKGDKGNKGDTGNSNAGLAILIGAISGVAGAVLGQLLNSILNGLMDLFGNVPEPTDENRVQALADLISQMKAEIDQLQAEMDTVQNEITTLQSEMGYQQEKTENMNTYTDIYLNNVSNFNSAITTTDGFFGESSRISKSGAAQFSSLKTSTMYTPYNKLTINGNLVVNGTIIRRGVNGNYQISGANWEF